jgi:hypothetical protein
MITPIDEHLINDLTKLSRSQLMKSTIIMDSAKRERITLTIMNGVIRRVHSVMLNHIRSEMAIARLYNTFKGEK